MGEKCHQIILSSLRANPKGKLIKNYNEEAVTKPRIAT